MKPKPTPTLYRYSKWLLQLSFWKTVLYFGILHEIVSDVFPFLAWLTNAGDVFAASHIESLIKDIIASIIFAPLVETLLAQWLLFAVVRYFTKNLYVLYFISSFVFAIGHNYNLWYMVAAFFIGLIYIGLFVVLSKKSLKHAYWGVVLVHAVGNTIAVTWNHW